MKNVIADFSRKDCDTLRVKGLTQWDYGQTLEIRLDNMPETFEAHFSAQNMDEALVVEAISVDGSAIIPIPNIITTQSKEATCYLYYEDETSGETHKTIILLIKPRKKPTDYVYTETEVFNYRIFKKELEAKIAKAGAVKTVNGNEPDENGNVEIELPKGSIGSWNDLTDKPFYEEGDPTKEQELLSTEIEIWGENEATITANDSILELFGTVGNDVRVIASRVYNVNDFAEGTFECKVQYDETNQYNYIEYGEAPHRIYVNADKNLTFIYNAYTGYGNYALKIIKPTYWLKQLDEKFIPDEIARVADVQSVNYTPQELESKQQMQVRKNLALPYVEYQRDLIANVAMSESGWYGEHAFTPYLYEDKNHKPNKVQIKVYDNGWDDSDIIINEEFEQKLFTESYGDGGGNYAQLRWYGNSDLIKQYDSDAYNIVLGSSYQEQNYPNAKIVYYNYVSREDYMSGESGTYKVIFSEDLTPSNDMFGYAINVYDASTEGIPTYITLEEEFIPDHTHSWNDLQDKPFGSRREKEKLAYMAMVEGGWNGSHMQYMYTYDSSKQAPNSIQMVVRDGDGYKSTIFDSVLEKQYKVTDIGNDFWCGFWWYGNLNLITEELDRDAKLTIDSLELTETKYSDVQFVYYGYSPESYGYIGNNTSLNGFKIIFSDDLTPSDSMFGYEINIFDAISEVTIHTPLPTEYLPSGVPKVNYAEVGQVIAVTAVNEYGMPTEWECVDVASDGTSVPPAERIKYISDFLNEYRQLSFSKLYALGDGIYDVYNNSSDGWSTFFDDVGEKSITIPVFARLVIDGESIGICGGGNSQINYTFRDGEFKQI